MWIIQFDYIGISSDCMHDCSAICVLKSSYFNNDYFFGILGMVYS